MSVKIPITCRACKFQFSVSRTEEIPEEVTQLECNWCPECEDENCHDYWEEYYLTIPVPEPEDPNQLKLNEEAKTKIQMRSL